MFGGFREIAYFCSNFLKPEEMKINHKTRMTFAAIAVVAAILPSTAQTPQCKDTAEHMRLQMDMWNACAQEKPKELYKACQAFQRHAKEEKDMFAAYTAWVCGVMYNLGRMNIHDAYHITRQMAEELEDDQDAQEERYFVPNMMGHVYSTCGNVPGAVEEFRKSVELIKGTRYEADGLAFIYLALAHAQLNNNLDEAERWIGETKAELQRHENSWNKHRAEADAYALEAIIRFKQRDLKGFRNSLALMEEADSKNRFSSGDLFVPYARIYQTLLDGNTEKALADAATLNNLKELYLVKCDIYRFIGDNEKAFLTQRELMHKRDSITGVMIAENTDTHEKEISLLTQRAKMTRTMNLILAHTVALSILVIVLMARNILIRHRSRKILLEKNQELKEANRKVTAADKMKTEFIRSVSHEIRTPLNIINGFSQVLTNEENTFEPEERHEIASTINTSTRQITSLVNKMLGLANENTKDLLKEVEDTDALAICHEAISAMPPVDPNSISVELEDQTNDKGTLLCTNSDSLLQMLGNMLENSVKFTEKGFIRLILRNDGRIMWFTVEDTGCGIPEDKISTIFERFVKVDEFKEGLGLGLAYCYETAGKLGGSLRLDHTSDEGTCFTLGLPLKVVKN